MTSPDPLTDLTFTRIAPRLYQARNYSIIIWEGGHTASRYNGKENFTVLKICDTFDEAVSVCRADYAPKRNYEYPLSKWGEWPNGESTRGAFRVSPVQGPWGNELWLPYRSEVRIGSVSGYQTVHEAKAYCDACQTPETPEPVPETPAAPLSKTPVIKLPRPELETIAPGVYRLGRAAVVYAPRGDDYEVYWPNSAADDPAYRGVFRTLDEAEVFCRAKCPDLQKS